MTRAGPLAVDWVLVWGQSVTYIGTAQLPPKAGLLLPCQISDLRVKIGRNLNGLCTRSWSGIL